MPFARSRSLHVRHSRAMLCLPQTLTIEFPLMHLFCLHSVHINGSFTFALNDNHCMWMATVLHYPMPLQSQIPIMGYTQGKTLSCTANMYPVRPAHSVEVNKTCLCMPGISMNTFAQESSKIIPACPVLWGEISVGDGINTSFSSAMSCRCLLLRSNLTSLGAIFRVDLLALIWQKQQHC